MPTQTTTTTTATANVVITKVLNASRELVWKAWTEPEQLRRWWGPTVFTNPVCELDLRPGGAMLIVMRAPDGTDYPMTGVFQEIVPPSRLVFTAQAVDNSGTALLESHTIVTLDEQDGKTVLTVQANAVGFVAQSVQMLAGMEAGWMQSLEKLEAELGKSTMTTTSDTNSTIQAAKTGFLEAKAQLCRALESTPDDRLNFSPSPTARTPIQMGFHAATAVQGVHGLLQGKPLPGATTAEADRIFREAEAATPHTREGVLALLDANSDAYVAYLEALTPEQLDSPVTLPFADGKSAPLSAMLTAATGHTLWHAAQINYVQTIYGDHIWH